MSASTHRTSVAVRVCLCVSVCVRQHTQDVRGCPSVHISARWSLDSACWPFPWTVWVIFDHVGSLFSTHRTSVGVCGCLCVSVCVRQHTQDVRGCPSVHISARWSLDSARWPFPWTVLVILAHVGCLFSTHRTSVGVRQHTQDIRGCPPAHTGRLWVSASTHRTSVGVRQHAQDVRCCLWLSVSTHRTSVAVRVCPCVSVSTHRTSVAVHQYTYQHVGPWTQHADPSRGHFG